MKKILNKVLLTLILTLLLKIAIVNNKIVNISENKSLAECSDCCTKISELKYHINSLNSIKNNCQIEDADLLNQQFKQIISLITKNSKETYNLQNIHNFLRENDNNMKQQQNDFKDFLFDKITNCEFCRIKKKCSSNDCYLRKKFFTKTIRNIISNQKIEIDNPNKQLFIQKAEKIKMNSLRPDDLYYQNIKFEKKIDDTLIQKLNGGKEKLVDLYSKFLKDLDNNKSMRIENVSEDGLHEKNYRSNVQMVLEESNLKAFRKKLEYEDKEIHELHNEIDKFDKKDFESFYKQFDSFIKNINLKAKSIITTYRKQEKESEIRKKSGTLTKEEKQLEDQVAKERKIDLFEARNKINEDIIEFSKGLDYFENLFDTICNVSSLIKHSSFYRTSKEKQYKEDLNKIAKEGEIFSSYLNKIRNSKFELNSSSIEIKNLFKL